MAAGDPFGAVLRSRIARFEADTGADVRFEWGPHSGWSFWIESTDYSDGCATPEEAFEAAYERYCDEDDRHE